MGASFITQRFKDEDEKELKKEFSKLIDELRHEYGHNPYNGTFTTNSGLDITSMVFKTEDDAEEWLVRNCEKWKAVRAVKICSFKKDVGPYWLLGAWCAS